MEARLKENVKYGENCDQLESDVPLDIISDNEQELEDDANAALLGQKQSHKHRAAKRQKKIKKYLAMV